MSKNQKSGQTDGTTDEEQPTRNTGAFESGRRNFIKLTGGLAASTAGLSTATGDARAANLYWDGVTLSQSSYDYAPSVMYGDGSRIKMWFCHPYYGDAIFYSELTSSGWTDPEVVMTKSPSGWDSHHVCDPSVIKGDFYADGYSWDYAMYYTGSTTEDGTDDEHNNHIGVAFSNTGTGWHKYSDNPVIRPKSVSDSYGAGMPTAYRQSSSDGYIYVAFFDSTDDHRNHYVASTDGKNFGSRTTITSDPGYPDTAIGDWAYHPDEGRWYVSTKHNSDRYTYLYTTETSYINSDWTWQGTIDGGLTGYTHNHNPCWMRWPNGDIREDSYGYRYVYLGVGNSDPDSWDIGQVRYWG